MKKRLTALVLAGALAVGLCGAAAFADEPAQEDPVSSQVIGEEQSQVESQPSQDIPEEDTSVPEEKVETETVQPEEEAEDDTPAVLGNVSFAGLADLVRKNNLNVLALNETIGSIEAIDYKEMKEEIGKQIEMIADTMSSMSAIELPPTGDVMQDGINQTLLELSKSSSIQSMQQAYATLEATYNDLKSGKIQDDNDAVIRQLCNAQDQIVMAAETLYVALVELQISNEGLTRSAAALDRTIQEMELRYSMGQISSLTLQEIKAGRTSLESGKATLEMTEGNLRTQLELMLGTELTGAIQVQPLNRISSRQLDAMDLEKDLEKAKDASYTVYAAERTLSNAEDDYWNARNSYPKGHYQIDITKHARNSAKYSCQATEESFENSFRALYNQVKDYKQILGAAETALAVEEASCAAAQLKYEQGTLAHNKLLDAQDELEAARDKVDTAAIDLFSAYNNYRWAVNYGILN